jgi:hypothetical protein
LLSRGFIFLFPKQIIKPDKKFSFYQARSKLIRFLGVAAALICVRHSLSRLRLCDCLIGLHFKIIVIGKLSGFLSAIFFPLEIKFSRI